jgi:hypothetical protein
MPGYEDIEERLDFSQIIPANPGWKAVFIDKDADLDNDNVYFEPVIAWGIVKKLYIEIEADKLGGEIEALYYRTEMVGFARVPGAGYSIYTVDDGMVEAMNNHFIGYEPPENEKTYDTEDWQQILESRKNRVIQKIRDSIDSK